MIVSAEFRVSARVSDFGQSFVQCFGLSDSAIVSDNFGNMYKAYTLSNLQFTADEAIKYYKEHIDEIDPEFKKSIQPIQSRGDGKDRLEMFAMKLGYPDGSP